MRFNYNQAAPATKCKERPEKKAYTYLIDGVVGSLSIHVFVTNLTQIFARRRTFFFLFDSFHSLKIVFFSLLTFFSDLIEMNAKKIESVTREYVNA